MQKKQIIRINKKQKFAVTTNEYIKLLKKVFKNYLITLDLNTFKINLILRLYDLKINEKNVFKYLNCECIILLNYLIN